MEPIYLKPNLIKTVWAGNRLSKIRKITEEKIGIIREVCAYKDSSNFVASGIWKGALIKEVITANHDSILGDINGNELVRVAYIDSAENLSIQVHPDEKNARLFDDFEKSESWYILDCDDDAYVVAGTSLTTKEALKTAIENQDLDRYLIKVPVKPGDFVMVPCNLLHACGKNILALEIGSFGGITYRLYDYGRGRPLQLDKGLEILDINLRCEKKSYPFEFRNRTIKQSAIKHYLYNVDILDIKSEASEKKKNHYHILTSVYGDFYIVIDEKEYPLTYTNTVIIPAEISSYKIRGNGRILISYQPI